MEYVALGKTGLNASVAGLGCGGPSRLGQRRGMPREHSISVVRQAFDLGVNFLDTAEFYGTESIVGDAISEIPRDKVIVSTKTHVRRDGRFLTAEQLQSQIDNALRTLKTDHVDIFNFHGVKLKDYQTTVDVLLPALERAREQGKIRFTGITEANSVDPEHEMLQVAVHDNLFDVIMYSFHMMHQNARELVIQHARRLGVGTLVMCAVRGFFSNPTAIKSVITKLRAAGEIPDWFDASRDDLKFLVHEGGATDIVDAAYRYARHEPGNQVILFGTGDLAHLRANITSILRPPLPAEDVELVRRAFGALAGVGLTDDLK